MKGFVFGKIVPYMVIFISLIAGAIFVDYLLHLAGLVYLGRYMGILGTSLILISFSYSLKKRKYINRGKIKTFLNNHEMLSWIGALSILVHAGIHFNAIIPWLAVFSMLIVVASGITGKYLLRQGIEELKNKEIKTREIEGDTNSENQLIYLALLVKKMQQWRKVHFPLTAIFITLSVFHIISILIYWSGL